MQWNLPVIWFSLLSKLNCETFKITPVISWNPFTTDPLGYQIETSVEVLLLLLLLKSKVTKSKYPSRKKTYNVISEAEKGLELDYTATILILLS